MTEFYNIFGNYINNKIETFADTNDCLIELELKNGEDCGDLKNQINKIYQMVDSGTLRDEKRIREILLKFSKLKNSMDGETLIIYENLFNLKVKNNDDMTVVGDFNLEGDLKAKNYYKDSDSNIGSLIDPKFLEPQNKQGDLILKSKQFIDLNGILKISGLNKDKKNINLISIQRFLSKGENDSLNFFCSDKFNIMSGNDLYKSFGVNGDGSVEILNNDFTNTKFNISRGKVKNIISGNSEIKGKLLIGTMKNLTRFNSKSRNNLIRNTIIGNKTKFLGNTFFSDSIDKNENMENSIFRQLFPKKKKLKKHVTQFNSINNKGKFINKLVGNKNIFNGQLIVSDGKNIISEFNKDGNNYINRKTNMEKIIFYNNGTMINHKENIINGEIIIDNLIFLGPENKQVVLNYESVLNVQSQIHLHPLSPYSIIDFVNKKHFKNNQLFSYIVKNNPVSFISTKYYDKKSGIKELADINEWIPSPKDQVILESSNNFLKFITLEEDNDISLNIKNPSKNISKNFTQFYYFKTKFPSKFFETQAGSYMEIDFNGKLSYVYKENENDIGKRILSNYTFKRNMLTILIVVAFRNSLTVYVNGKKATVILNDSDKVFGTQFLLKLGNIGEFSIAGIINKVLNSTEVLYLNQLIFNDINDSNDKIEVNNFVKKKKLTIKNDQLREFINMNFVLSFINIKYKDFSKSTNHKTISDSVNDIIWNKIGNISFINRGHKYINFNNSMLKVSKNTSIDKLKISENFTQFYYIRWNDKNSPKTLFNDDNKSLVNYEGENRNKYRINYLDNIYNTNVNPQKNSWHSLIIVAFDNEIKFFVNGNKVGKTITINRGEKFGGKNLYSLGLIENNINKPPDDVAIAGIINDAFSENKAMYLHKLIFNDIIDSPQNNLIFTQNIYPMALENWIGEKDPISYLDANKIIFEESKDLTHFKDYAPTDLNWRKRGKVLIEKTPDFNYFKLFNSYLEIDNGEKIDYYEGMKVKSKPNADTNFKLATILQKNYNGTYDIKYDDTQYGKQNGKTEEELRPKEDLTNTNLNYQRLSNNHKFTQFYYLKWDENEIKKYLFVGVNKISNSDIPAKDNLGEKRYYLAYTDENKKKLQTTDKEENNVDLNFNINTNKWHSLIIVFNTNSGKGNVSCYIDGILKSFKTSDIKFGKSSYLKYLGSGGEGTNQEKKSNYPGKIALAGVLNKPLDMKEVNYFHKLMETNLTRNPIESYDVFEKNFNMQEYIKNNSDTDTLLSMYDQNLLDDQSKEEIDGLSVEQFLEYWKENLVTFINGKDYTSSDDTFITDSVGNKYDISYNKWNDNFPVLDTESYKVSQLIDGNNFNFTLYDDDNDGKPRKLVYEDDKYFHGIYLQLNSEKILTRNYTQFFKLEFSKHLNPKEKLLFNNGTDFDFLSKIENQKQSGDEKKIKFQYKAFDTPNTPFIDDYQFPDSNTEPEPNTYIITNEKKNNDYNKINIYFNGVNVVSDIQYVWNGFDKFKYFGYGQNGKEKGFPEKVQYAGIINERLSDTAIKILHEKMSQ